MKLNRTLIIIFAAALVVGLLTGYGIWGTKTEKKLTLKQMLDNLIQEVEIIEKENMELKGTMDKAKTDITTATELSKENKALKEQLQKFEQGNKQLQSQVSRLKNDLSLAGEKARADEEQKALNDNLKTQIAELEKDRQALEEHLQRLQQDINGLKNIVAQVNAVLSAAKEEIIAHQEQKRTSDNLASQVSELEGENAALRQIVDNIKTITANEQIMIPDMIPQTAPYSKPGS